MQIPNWYHLTTGANVLLLVVCMLLVFSWPRCRSRLILCAWTLLQVAIHGGWWAWSFLVNTEAWAGLDRYSPLLEKASMLGGLFTGVILVLFAFSMRSELVKLRAGAGTATPAGSRTASVPRHQQTESA